MSLEKVVKRLLSMLKVPALGWTAWVVGLGMAVAEREP